LTNENGWGGDQPWVLGTLIYKGVILKDGEEWFEPVLNTLTQYFLFAPLKLCRQKNYS
jgi:hypothetical protein